MFAFLWFVVVAISGCIFVAARLSASQINAVLVPFKFAPF